MNLICGLCEFTAKGKFEFIEHLDAHQKIEQISIRNELSKIKKESGSCRYCNKIISNFYNYQTHRKKCLSPEELIFLNLSKITNKEIFSKIISECRQKLNQNVGVTQHNSISGGQNSIIENVISGDNNINNVNHISINLNNIRDENLQILESGNPRFQQKLLDTLGTYDKNEVRSLRKFNKEAIKNTFLTLFEELYFNDKYPENHNLYVNHKTYYKNFHVYVDDKWSRTGDLNTIKDIIVRLKEIFQEWITKTIEDIIKDDPSEETDHLEYLRVLCEDLDIFIGGLKEEEVPFMSAKKLIKEFFDIAYKNRLTVKKTFDITRQEPIKKLKLCLERHDKPKKIRMRIKGNN